MLYDIWYISWPILDTLYIIVSFLEPKIEVLQDMFQLPIKTDPDLWWVEYTVYPSSGLHLTNVWAAPGSTNAKLSWFNVIANYIAIPQ